MRARSVLTALALTAVAACSGGSGGTAPSAGTPRAGAGSSAAVSPGGSGEPTGAAAGPGTPSTAGASSTSGLGTQTAAATPVTLAFAGDVHFERNLRTRLAADPRTALGSTARRALSAADLAVVNLETAVTDRGTPQPKRFHFRAPATAFRALRGAGVDVATMANNHAMDYGVVGLRDSLAAAAAARFPVIGLGADEDAAYAPYQVTVKGQRLAILAATTVIDDILIPTWTAGPGKPGVASAKRVDRLVAAVRAARRDADAVVVFVHWGAELDPCPTPTQRDVERALVGAGADVIVGSHVHWLLGGGWDPKGPYVDYGLGNFAFYASGIGRTTESGVLTLTLQGRKVTDARWSPARIRSGVPVAATGADGARIAARKEQACACTGLRATPPR